MVGNCVVGQHKRASQPIVRHPLFPSVVALWFGALFAFAGLVLSPVVLERAVLATGIDSIVPAAAPPHGMTARILVALVLLVVGAIAGLKTGRVLATPRPVARERRRGPAAPVPAQPARPLSIREDVGTLDGIPQEQAAGPAGRRRGLTATEDDSLERFDDIAPLPGGPPQVLDLSDLAVPAPVTLAFDPQGDHRPFAHKAAAPAMPPVAADPADAPESIVAGDPARPFAAPDSVLPEPEPEPDYEQELEPRFQPTPASVVAPAAAGAPAPEPVAVEFPLPKGSAAERIASADVGALSNVELIERLALSLQRRRERDEAERLASADAAARPHLAPTPAAEDPVQVDAAPAIVPAPLTRFAPLASMDLPVRDLPTLPLALRPLAFADDGDTDADELPAYVPPRHISLASFGGPAEEEEEEKEEDVSDEVAMPEIRDDSASDSTDADGMLEDGYSSLLALSRPAQTREPCIRIEDADPLPSPSAEPEPVVVFPGQAIRPPVEAGATRAFDPPGAAPAPTAPAAVAAIPDPDETERALRAALATLQRMSGAA